MTTFTPKLFTTLRDYSTRQFLADGAAGIIVALIAFPLSIALGIASGVSPETGLYTAVVGCTIVAIFGGSRVQIAGPTGAFVVVVYGIIQVYGLDGLAIATIMAGILLVLMGIFRLGSIISMIPYPITTGFTSGIAITIAATQIQDFFGISATELPAEFVPKIVELLRTAGTVNPWALAVGAGTLAILILWPRLRTPVPPALVAVVVATAVTAIFGLPVETVGSRFGQLSAALPALRLPELSWEKIGLLIQPALTIAALAAIESLLSAVVADGMIGGNHRPNVELLAQGGANILSALVGGIPVTGAIARTAANVKNGGRTPVAGVVSGLALFAMLQFLLPAAQQIPMSALAAVLLVVAFNMGEWAYFREIRRAPKSDYGVFLATFALTTLFDLVVGILVGLVMAVLLFMRRMSEVSGVELVAEDDGGLTDRLFEFEKTRGVGGYGRRALAARSARSAAAKSTAVYRIRGPFYFGAAEKFLVLLRRLRPEVQRVILDLAGVPALDATAFRALEMMHRQLAAIGGELVLVGLNEHPRQVLTKYGFLDAAGVQVFEGSLEQALGESPKTKETD